MEFGDPSDPEDRKRLQGNSPIRNLEKMRAPLLVVHGTDDTRVRIAQTRRFYTEAKAARIDIEYLELEDGTHFLDEYENRLAVFEALDGFLKEHL